LVGANDHKMKEARKNLFDSTLKDTASLKKIGPTEFGAFNKASAGFFDDLEKEKPAPKKEAPKPAG